MVEVINMHGYGKTKSLYLLGGDEYLAIAQVFMVRGNVVQNGLGLDISSEWLWLLRDTHFAQQFMNLVYFRGLVWSLLTHILIETDTKDLLYNVTFQKFWFLFLEISKDRFLFFVTQCNIHHNRWKYFV